MSEAVSQELRDKLFSKLAIPLCPDWAAVMGFSRQTAVALAEKGQIAGAFKMGRRWRVPTASLRQQLMLEPEQSQVPHGN